MGSLFDDLRYGFPHAAETPVVSTIAALSLALGNVGATAMFALASPRSPARALHPTHHVLGRLM